MSRRRCCCVSCANCLDNASPEELQVSLAGITDGTGCTTCSDNFNGNWITEYLSGGYECVWQYFPGNEGICEMAYLRAAVSTLYWNNDSGYWQWSVLPAGQYAIYVEVWRGNEPFIAVKEAVYQYIHTDTETKPDCMNFSDLDLPLVYDQSYRCIHTSATCKLTTL